ncbi:unnamed protein product, partial [Didymodactylos carnosus]
MLSLCILDCTLLKA